MLKMDDAIIGINGPTDYKYMRLLRLLLRTISGWAGKELGEKTFRFEGMVHAYYNNSLSLVYLAMGISYLKIHRPELTFLELGHMYIVFLLNMLSTSRAMTLCLSTKYRAVAKQFIQKLHLFHHKHKSDFAKSIHVKVHFISHIFTIYLTLMMVMVLLLFNGTPICSNYMKGKYTSIDDLVNTTYEHAIYLTYPFNSDSNFYGYLAATLFNGYGSYLCASSICMFDLFLSLMIFNLWGHFKILINTLETIPKPAALNIGGVGNYTGITNNFAIYSEYEQKHIAQILKECIEHHRLIVDFTNKMSDAFGMTLFAYLMFHQVAGCLMLLEVSVGSEKLRDAVYHIPWEHMDNRNRKTVLIYIINVQEPIHINAGGVVSVGVTTMASIIKTSLSYFAFLRTVAD